MKISSVLTNSGTGVVGQLDNLATKTVLTALDATKSCKQEIIMAGLGFALGTLGADLEMDMDFMAGAIDGELDLTDIGLMADEVGMAMVGLAAVTASQKINKKFEELSCIDDMDDAEFEAFLANGADTTKVSKKVSSTAVVELEADIAF
ncbi:MAG: hypothetical protein ACRCX2_01835 [Paraclostridium sp.]